MLVAFMLGCLFDRPHLLNAEELWPEQQRVRLSHGVLHALVLVSFSLIFARLLCVHVCRVVSALFA